MAIGKNNSESFPTPVEADAGFSLLDLVDPVRPSFNSMARLGGFDTKNEEELRLLTAPELTQYNKDRANARMKGIGEMLFILSDAFAGKDILGRSMGRRQAKLKEAEIARQRQKALEQEELIKSLGAGMSPDMRVLAQMFPQVYAAERFREKKPTSASEQLKLMELDVLKTLEGYEGSFEERVARLEKEQPAKYGIYKDSIEKSESFNLLQKYLENQFGNDNVIDLSEEYGSE